MATRNILDYQGNVIGELTLPDDTTDAQWAAVLAPYAQPPISTAQILATELAVNQVIGYQLLNKVKALNVINGITLAQSAQMFQDYLPILMAVREGAFPTAIYMLQNATPSGFVTQDMINQWIALIQTGGQ